MPKRPTSPLLSCGISTVIVLRRNCKKDSRNVRRAIVAIGCGRLPDDPE
jgi:hypothetical protein